MWIYIALLILIGFFLLFAELFVPGGILGVIGIGAMGGAVWLCFNDYGPQQGFFVLLFCVIGVVVFVIAAFKLIPHTFVGRWLILDKKICREDGVGPSNLDKENLVGKEGVAESGLRPAGIAVIGGNRYDVVTEGEYILPRSRIRVLRVDSNRIVVTQA